MTSGRSSPLNKLITDTGRRKDEDVADSPVRWGILGTGGIASAFVSDLKLTGSGVAVAVGSRSQESADRFAGTFGIANRHASYESLAADPDVDVIYVATPHPMHHGDALMALRAGKHVLVEKPFTMNAAEARDIVALARQRGLFAMEAMWTRFLPHMAETAPSTHRPRSRSSDVTELRSALRRLTEGVACGTRTTRWRAACEKDSSRAR